MVVEGVAFVSVKFQYSFSFSLADGEFDISLEGDENKQFTAEEKKDIVDEFANTGKQLKWNCIYAIHDNKKVFSDPPRSSPKGIIPEDNTESHVAQLTVFDV